MRTLFLCAALLLAGCTTSGPSPARVAFDVTTAYTVESGKAVTVSRRLASQPDKLAALQRLDADAHAAILPVRAAIQSRQTPTPDLVARADAAVDALAAFVAQEDRR